jgi:hypothetical protein
MTSESEFEELLAQHRALQAREARDRLLQASGLIAQFTEVAARAGVTLDSSAFDYVPTIGIIATAPGLATELLSPIEPSKDGLYSFSILATQLPPPKFQEGYFRGATYTLMAHPCYRRMMFPVSNWAPRFIDLYWTLNLPGVEKYIAIDEDRVRIDVDGPSYVEADTWYGAPFNEEIRKIPAGTVKLRPPADLTPHHIDFYFARNYCLDIKWSEAREVKSFQALELKSSDVFVDIGGHKLFPARYLHAEFDMVANTFRHFDGAVQFLSESEYMYRRDSDFNINLKGLEHVKARSRKVFKLNGPMPTATWVELCCHFFHANPLTFEYFTGSYPKHVNDFLANLRSSEA